jgi:hypothetical protein
MATLNIDPTSGITYPDGVVQTTATPNPSTSGNLLVSNGTAWVSQAAPTGIPSGTAMFFKQTSAPTGWTKDTGLTTNSGIRVVTGTASTGGSVDFTTAFASQAVAGTVGNYGSFTLTTTELPSHTHTLQAASFNAGYLGGANAVDRGTQTTSSTGGGGGHTHTGGTFTGTAINLAVKYVDFIVATKN